MLLVGEAVAAALAFVLLQQAAQSGRPRVSRRAAGPVGAAQRKQSVPVGVLSVECDTSGPRNPL